MQRIICDTMIWYYLSQDKVKIPDPDKYILVCTYLSLTELAFSQNNFNKLREVQQVIKSIFNIRPEIILSYPIDHALELIDTEYQFEHKIEEDLVLGFLKVILNHPGEGLIDNEFKEQLLFIVNKRKVNYEDWANFLNDLHEGVKEIGHIVKKFHNDDSDKSNFRGWFVRQLNESSFEKKYSAGQVNWEKFELHEKVGARYMRNMYLTRMKADRNDENDLQNMIYVQPGDLYWTLEKR